MQSDDTILKKLPQYLNYMKFKWNNEQFKILMRYHTK